MQKPQSRRVLGMSKESKEMDVAGMEHGKTVVGRPLREERARSDRPL